jgi:hypothetical protein
MMKADQDFLDYAEYVYLKHRINLEEKFDVKFTGINFINKKLKGASMRLNSAQNYSWNINIDLKKLKKDLKVFGDFEIQGYFARPLLESGVIHELSHLVIKENDPERKISLNMLEYNLVEDFTKINEGLAHALEYYYLNGNSMFKKDLIEDKIGKSIRPEQYNQSCKFYPPTKEFYNKLQTNSFKETMDLYFKKLDNAREGLDKKRKERISNLNNFFRSLIK